MFISRTVNIMILVNIIAITITISIIIVRVISMKALVVSLFISSTLRWGSNCLLVWGAPIKEVPVSR